MIFLCTKNKKEDADMLQEYVFESRTQFKMMLGTCSIKEKKIELSIDIGF